MKLMLNILLGLLILACNPKLTELDFAIREKAIIVNNLPVEDMPVNSFDVLSVSLWDAKENKAIASPIVGISDIDENGVLTFIPEFPFMIGNQYRVTLEYSGVHQEKILSFESERKGFPEVVAIYPSEDSLPENLLRFYISFSHPMKTLDNIQRIQLVDNEGVEVSGAIFNNVQELWDKEQKTLTIILDPSRVKTDLIANKELGRSLVEGGNYKLIINGFESVDNRSMQSSYSKEFYVKNEDIIAPNINDWMLTIPDGNSANPLTVQFPDVLDRMSLFNRIQLIDENGGSVEGNRILGAQQRSWAFYPKDNWNKGGYQLLVNSRLEDPSGNNLNGLFDHKIGTLKHKREGEVLFLEFQVD